MPAAPSRSGLRGLLARGRRMRPSDLPLLLRALVLLMALPAALRILGLRPLLRRLMPGAPGGGGAARRPSPELGERTIAMVRGLLSARLGPLRPACLRQSLVLFHLLRRQGWPAVIHFGVRRGGDGLDGHAWLEIDGHPVAEPVDPASIYTTVWTFPGPQGADGRRPAKGQQPVDISIF
ncbi:MAG: lasso peptide biosynthesis B2 protein [Acidobacteriota bacterium]